MITLITPEARWYCRHEYRPECKQCGAALKREQKLYDASIRRADKALRMWAKRGVVA